MRLITRSYRTIPEEALEEIVQFGLDMKAIKLVYDEVTEPSGHMVVLYFKDKIWTIGSSYDRCVGTLTMAAIEPEFDPNPAIIVIEEDISYE